MAIAGEPVLVRRRQPALCRLRKRRTPPISAAPSGWRPARARTIDPARAYDAAAWSILSMTNDGLVGFQRVGRPQGARHRPRSRDVDPAPERRRTTYTFQLRRGIRYSNGTTVQPTISVLGSSARSRWAGSRPSYFQSSSALKHARRPATCDLSDGVVSIDAAPSLTFHLTEPDPNLLYTLAMPPAFAVPEGTPKSPIRPRRPPHRAVSDRVVRAGQARFDPARAEPSIP